MSIAPVRRGRATQAIAARPSSRDLDEVDVVVPPTAATFKRAQLFVASESLNVEDARELLGALGLLP